MEQSSKFMWEKCQQTAQMWQWFTWGHIRQPCSQEDFNSLYAFFAKRNKKGESVIASIVIKNKICACAHNLHVYHETTSKMVYHRGASLSEHPLLNLMFCHTNLGICHCCSMSMVSKTSYSHFSDHYATYTLNLTMKSWAESLALMRVLTWSKLNYCAWFDDTDSEQPALVCHGTQSHSADPSAQS